MSAESLLPALKLLAKIGSELAKRLLELRDVVDCFPMTDQKQPHRSRHGAHRGRYEASWSFIDDRVVQRKRELQECPRIVFAGRVRVSADMTKPALSLPLNPPPDMKTTIYFALSEKTLTCIQEVS